MSERFSKLFSLPENLYAEHAPVIVSAGNLLKDNQTGKVLAQLKMKNLSQKKIKAVTVVVHALDTVGNALDGDTEKEYLDLSVEQGKEFGQKTAVPLPNTSTRGITVEVKSAFFEDNSTWKGSDDAWEPLPKPESLSKKLCDAELVKQYQIHFGGKCVVLPQEHKDLWRCACGEWNKDEKCCCCGKEKNALLGLEIAALNEEKAARQAKEKAEFEAKETASKAAEQARAKKTKKTLAFAIPAAIVFIILLFVLNNVRINYLQEQARRAAEQALLAEEQELQAVKSEIIGTYVTSYQDRDEQSLWEWTWAYVFAPDGSASLEVTNIATYYVDGRSITLSPTIVNHSGNYSIDNKNDQIIITFNDDFSQEKLLYVVKSNGTIELIMGSYHFTKAAG